MRLISAVAVVVASLAVSGQPIVAQSAGAVYDANDQLVGLFADTGPGATFVHSLRGYRFLVEPNGRVSGGAEDIAGVLYNNGRPWFESLDCTGPAYLVPSVASNLAGGFVTRLTPSSLGYVQKAPTVANVTLRSVIDNGTTCLPVSPPAATNVVPVLPNDPAVTGVPNADFAPPLRLEVVPMTSLFELFKDGFESVQLNAACEAPSGHPRFRAQAMAHLDRQGSLTAQANQAGQDPVSVRVWIS